MSQEIINALVGNLKEALEAKNEVPFQYVVEYRRISDDSFIGYHLSTFCQLTDDKLSAKRYSGENAYNQLKIIHNNLKTVLAAKEGDTLMFNETFLLVQEKYFKGISINDIYLDAVYLDTDVPKQTFEVTQI